MPPGTDRLKVALVHDWLTGMRGGERVLERLCHAFPDAPIHTLIWNRGSVSSALESRRIEASFLQRVPGVARHYRWYLPLFPRAIESFDLTGYDVVVSSSHCVAKGVRVPRGTFHLSYVHTPMRYIWDLETQYFPPGRFPWPVSIYVRSTCAALRRWDVASTQGVHALLSNSRHVAARIRRHWRRDAETVYPPIELDRFAPRRGARDYYLLAGAAAPYKRGDLAIEACRILGRRLVVAGSGPLERRLRELAGPDVEFLGWVADERMAELYAGARGLLFPGEEDFGMIPLEALASGCPVVAFGQGGALETVGSGAVAADLERIERGGTAAVPGGVLFGAQTAASMVEGLRILEQREWDPERLRALATPFATAAFDRRFREAFERHYRAWGDGRTGQ
jgi:glycosyltransferase involved in cell wall biosynthesis